MLWFGTALRLTAQVETIAPGLARTAGLDTGSGIAYTRLYLSAQGAVAASAFDLSQATLTAQCSRRPDGRMLFELFVNFGGVTDTAFYRPWTAADGGLFAPRTAKARYTMEFLGYTKVSPVKREFEHVLAPDGQLRYNEPGGGSGNMEPVSYYLRYLRSLPTLRVTGEGHTATFVTTPLLTRLHAEPMCSASGV